jgi:hypothetical protein
MAYIFSSSQLVFVIPALHVSVCIICDRHWHALTVKGMLNLYMLAMLNAQWSPGGRQWTLSQSGTPIKSPRTPKGKENAAPSARRQNYSPSPKGRHITANLGRQIRLGKLEASLEEVTCELANSRSQLLDREAQVLGAVTARY